MSRIQRSQQGQIVMRIDRLRVMPVPNPLGLPIRRCKANAWSRHRYSQVQRESSTTLRLAATPLRCIIQGMPASFSFFEYLRRAYQAIRSELILPQRSQMPARFQERFSVERLRSMGGRDLLYELHGRTSRDSMKYWLEFKNDDVFATDLFGGIGGGSALKFVVYQSAEDGQWYTGAANQQKLLSEAEAAQISEKQRDQLLAAREVVCRLPVDAEAAAYRSLVADIAKAAPDYAHLGFFHKYLFLQAPDRIDDFHSVRYQHHQLLRLGIEPPADNLYAGAGPLVVAWRRFLALLGESELSLSGFAELLNRVNGGPVSYWRIGVGRVEGGAERWTGMRDGGYVAIGWPKLGDLAKLTADLQGASAKDAVGKGLEQHYLDDTPQVRGRHTNQIWNFFANVQVGDWVIAADGMEVCGVGRVVGPYEYQDRERFPNRRKVEWLALGSWDAPDKSGLLNAVYRLDGKWPMLLSAIAHVTPERRSFVTIGNPTPQPPLPRPELPALEPTVALIDTELSRKGQVILYGPPGTGKTYWASRAAKELVARACFNRAFADLDGEQQRALVGEGSKESQRIFTCVFHPSLGYEEFVEGLRPTTTQGGALTFTPRAGLFRQVADAAAKRPREPFFLIIDEINRGDVARIFGELLLLLELDKRSTESVVLLHSTTRLMVPKNLRIIGTMNTADRSIALLDTALRRRFAFIELLPEPARLRGAQIRGLELERLLEALNQRLVRSLGSDARGKLIGHSFFLHAGTPLRELVHLRQVLRHEIFPLLQEYCYSEPALLERVVGPAFLERGTRQLQWELFDSGREDALLAALSKWGDAVVASPESQAAPDEDAEGDANA